MAHYGRTRSELIDNADLANEVENRIRAEILGDIRGFGRNAYLFSGFPSDAKWRRVEAGPEDLEKLYYAKYPTWEALSGGARRVLDGAANLQSISTDVNAHILAVAKLVEAGQEFPELIAVQNGDSRFVLMEGHTRATAYALAGVAHPVEILVASSTQMQTWSFL